MTDTASPFGDDPRRRIPRTDTLLADPAIRAAAGDLAPETVRECVREAQGRARSGTLAPEQVAGAVVAVLTDRSAVGTTLREVLNATGVVLHTNIGRAPLSPAARAAVLAASGYVDVEFDLDTASRARRGRGTLAALLDAVPDAAGALVVNNGAAALSLATTALSVAAGRPEVVVGRGEMVEIGDGFRLPDLIETTGVRLREVGTTNRTSVQDYADAIGPDTGAVLRVHPSNFRIEGFTGVPTIAETAALCRDRDVPLIADIGSGLLRPDPLLPDEPDAASVLRAGAHVVTASGDKLLGGPQAGLVLGDAALVERLRRHPLARAFRVDKLTLAALEATLRGGPTPTTTALHLTRDDLRGRTRAVADAVGGTVVETDGAVGGGSAPGLTLPGLAVALPESFATALRAADPPVVGRLEHGHCLLDLRCIPPDDDARLVAAVRAVAGA